MKYMDPILKLSGLGIEVWANIDPDEYVRGEREAWEDNSNSETQSQRDLRNENNTKPR